MTDFRTGLVSIRLRNDMGMNHSMPLDSVLGGMLWEITQDGEKSGACDMVGRMHGVPMASNIILVGDTIFGSVPRIHSLGNFFQRAYGHDRIPFERVNDVMLRGKRGAYKNVFTKTPTFLPSGGIAFLVHGDLEAIRKLLLRGQNIGTARSSGKGLIGSVEITELDCDPKSCVAVGGTPLRAIPAEIAHEFGVDATDANVDDAYYRNPYAPQVASRLGIEPTHCCVPETDYLWVAHLDDIKRIIAG